MGRGWTKITNKTKKVYILAEKRAIFGRGWTKIRNTGRKQAVKHRAIHWPASLCYGLTKIRMILAEDWLANIGRY